MNDKSVAVLMSTYNGEKFLKEQIESILNQSYDNLHLFIRDDGSSDGTLRILKMFDTYPNVTIDIGEKNLGYKNSFLTLLKIVSSSKQKFDYYAFSDQDDIWETHKISAGIIKLENNSTTQYRLYFSGLTFVNETLDVLKVKDDSLVNTTFGAEMVRHSISGATTIISKSLAELAVTFDEIFDIPGGHDAFIFRLNAAIGGIFMADQKNYIKFRRHDDNTSSATKGYIYKIFNELKSNDNVVTHTAELLNSRYFSYITEENKELLKELLDYSDSFLSKIKLLRNKKFRRENKIMNFIFFFRVLMNKV